MNTIPEICSYFYYVHIGLNYVYKVALYILKITENPFVKFMCHWYLSLC